MRVVGSLQRESDSADAFVGGTSPDPLDLTDDTPGTPAANTVRLFRRAIAGRQFPAFIGPSGLDSSLQPLMARNKVGFWNPPGNASTVAGVFGFTAFQVVGTATARTVDTASFLGRCRRLGYVSAASSATFTGPRVNVAQISTGDTLSGIPVGGFFKLIRFGIADAGAIPTSRMFVGISAALGSPTNVEPDTVVNQVGLVGREADTNLQFQCCGATTQALIDLGANFPKSTIGATYELALFCAPGSLDIHWQVTRLDAGPYVAIGTVTGTSGVNVPAPSTLLSYSRNYRSTGTGVIAAAIDILSDYIETDF